MMPIDLNLYKHIMTNSKYIPEDTRAAFSKRAQRYDNISIIWSLSFQTYILCNFLCRKKRWWKMTSSFKTTLKKLALFYIIG